MKTLFCYILFSFLKILVFTFIVIKPKMELCFSLSIIESIITNFVSQKVKNFFIVTVKGPTLNFNYFSTCFCVGSNYIITHITSSLLTLFKIPLSEPQENFLSLQDATKIQSSWNILKASNILKHGIVNDVKSMFTLKSSGIFSFKKAYP